MLLRLNDHQLRTFAFQMRNGQPDSQWKAIKDQLKGNITVIFSRFWFGSQVMEVSKFARQRKGIEWIDGEAQ